jgi:uncharacterized protein YqgV (UPF0045/DUF77 family)
MIQVVPSVRAEFTIEPFVDGAPGPHVLAALDAVRTAGLTPDVGPFGTSVEGDTEQVCRALDRMLGEALAAGATRVSVQVTRVQD